MEETEYERRLAAFDTELAELREQAKLLEEEVLSLRRKLQDAPKRVRTLEERLLESKGQLAQAVSQNEKLSYTLREAREHIAALREEVDKLTQPPSAYGVVVGRNDDGTVDVLSGGRKMRVALSPEVDLDSLERGQEVVLNESLNVVLARGNEVSGEVVTIKDILEDGTRALIVGRADEERVCELADVLIGEKLRGGRPPLDGPEVGPPAREAASPRGRGARARRGARHLLRRCGWSRRADRADRRRGRAAVRPSRAVRRAPASRAEGHPPLRASRVRQDAASRRLSPTRSRRRSPRSRATSRHAATS